MKNQISVRSSLLMAAAAFLAAAPMLAVDGQDGEHHARRGERMHAERGPGGPHGEGQGMHRVLRALELSEEQEAQVREIMTATRESTAPSREQGQDLHDQMRALQEQEDPNPEELGRLMLEARALREAMRAEHEAAMDQVRALLTPEQLQKLELIEEMRGEGREGRKGRREGRRSGPRGGGQGR